MYNKTYNELISTQGYSNNEINIWSQPKMELLHKITGHKARVLQLAASPDGKSIVTGSGDETMRFWELYPDTVKQKHEILG